MNTLKQEKKLAVLRSLVEGNSLRSTSRITGVHKTTIMKVLNETGERCSQLLNIKMKNVPCRVIECDELWTFVAKKERNLTLEEKRKGKVGDQYIFVAIDPATKLVPVFTIGKRDAFTTNIFVQELRDRIKGVPQITTDGFRPYTVAIERAFGGEAHYATLVKSYEAENPGPGRYSPPSVSNVDIKRISGFPENDKISTSYVERNNLTMRMALKRLNRLTLAFSKSWKTSKLLLISILIIITFAVFMAPSELLRPCRQE